MNRKHQRKPDRDRRAEAGGRKLEIGIYLARLVKAARLEEDKKIKRLVRAAVHSDDPVIQQDVIEYLNAKAAEQAINPDFFAPPPTREEAWGEFELGIIRNSGCIFGISREELVQHVLAVGRTGTGKTTTIRKLVKEVIRRGRE